MSQLQGYRGEKGQQVETLHGKQDVLSKSRGTAKGVNCSKLYLELVTSGDNFGVEQ